MLNFIDRYLEAHRQLQFPLDCSIVPWLEEQRIKLNEINNDDQFEKELQIYSDILDHESTKPSALYQMLLKGNQFFHGEIYNVGQKLVIDKLINYPEKDHIQRIISILAYYASKNRLQTTDEVKKIILDYATDQGWYDPATNTVDTKFFK